MGPIIYTARAVTDFGDTYVWVYKDRPIREQVVLQVRAHDGERQSIEWYNETTSVFIEGTYLI